MVRFTSDSVLVVLTAKLLQLIPVIGLREKCKIRVKKNSAGAEPDSGNGHSDTLHVQDQCGARSLMCR